MIDNVDINKMISPVSSRGKTKSIHQQHPDKQHKNFNRQLREEDENNREEKRKGRFSEIDGVDNKAPGMQEMSGDGDEDNDTGRDKLNEMQGILLDIIV
ncbi:MAG: hypothetical protein U9Q38_04430 [Thermodesulfobacteriota bacterium]|nr:hypothetical protein [Thermodesulfobacteriota bacterium]